jgi:hypothetical protein
MSDTNPPADHPFVEEQTPGKRFEDNVRSRATWTRFVFMAISFVLLWLASIVGIAIVGFGFVWVLITGEVNRELRGVGQSLASYAYENIRYLTFNTDDRPFPFGNKWPASDFDEE